MNEYAKFRKVFGLIPEKLYFTLVKNKKFNSEWDSWLTQAIVEKLKMEVVMDD